MGGSVFVPCLLCNTLCPFPVLSSFAIILTRKRESDCCFTSIVFLMSCDCLCPVALPHGAVGWSAVCDCGTVFPK